MARHHLDELRQTLAETGWQVESTLASSEGAICGVWVLRHDSGDRRRMEFTAGSGSLRFEDSMGCHMENDKSVYAYFSAVPTQWMKELSIFSKKIK